LCRASSTIPVGWEPFFSFVKPSPRRKFAELFLRKAYSSSINVLDFPSIVIPVTTADEVVDTIDPKFQPFTEKDKLNMEACKSFDRPGSP